MPVKNDDEWDIPTVEDVDALFAKVTPIRAYPKVPEAPDVSNLRDVGLDPIDTSTVHRWNQTRREVHRTPQRVVKSNVSLRTVDNRLTRQRIQQRRMIKVVVVAISLSSLLTWLITK